MGLAERLEKLAKQLDRGRWNRAPFDYNIDAVEVSDLLTDAARQLRGYHLLVDQARSSLAKH